MNTKVVAIQSIDRYLSTSICQSITTTLPEWFGIPEANQRYATGVQKCVSFAAYIADDPIGLISLEFPYPNNAHIYWIGVKKHYHRQQIGTQLIRVAENYCRAQGYTSLTVETLSHKQSDANYLKTYYFYQKQGFKPLFELSPYGPDNLMVYMQKIINIDNLTLVDLTHVLTAEIPHWNSSCGFQQSIETDYADGDNDVKFRVQKLAMYAGIGTHIDSPAHCIPGGLCVADIPLEKLLTPCVVIDVSLKAHEKYSVSAEDIHAFEMKHGTIAKNTFVIIYTGWELFWQQPQKYRNELVFPSISKQAAELLLTRDIVGLGIDTLSPDRPQDGFPVHQAILGAGKFIIENVANAKKMPSVGAYISVFPLKIYHGTEAPVRLIGMKIH